MAPCTLQVVFCSALFLLSSGINIEHLLFDKMVWLLVHCKWLSVQPFVCSPVVLILNICYFTAWVGSLYIASGCLFSPVSSHISDRFSYRFTAILGSLAGISGFFLASLSSELWMMYLTVGVLSGFGHVMIFNSCSLIVLQYFVKWRSVASGIVASAPAIGMFVMTQITQSLLNTFGWRGPLRGFALLHIVCGFCSAIFVPLNNMKEKRNNANTNGKIRCQETTRKNASLWRNYSFLIMLSSFTVVIFAYWVPTVHIVSNSN